MSINFTARLEKVGPLIILRVPKISSAKLPSRGLVIVKANINGIDFIAPLEPDGKGSHWFNFNKSMMESIGVVLGDNLKVEIEPTKNWPEPDIPEDLEKALGKDSEAKKIWEDITIVSRWDWIRWIGSTKNPETRKIRIEKTLSKLRGGKRSACCFNRSECTDSRVSNSGVLMDSFD